MTTLLETHGAIITLDGLPIGQDHNPHHFLLKFQGQSTDYALTHGGYGIVTDDGLIRGYMAYLTVKDRRGYGVNGFIVRAVENLQAVSLTEGGRFTTDIIFCEHVAAPQLKAITHALDYTEGHMANLNGVIAEWVQTLRVRFELSEDDI